MSERRSVDVYVLVCRALQKSQKSLVTSESSTSALCTSALLQFCNSVLSDDAGP
jgi:nicotinamide mononucleotide (NMN) deamidase PncC